MLRVNLIAALAGERGEFEVVTDGSTFFVQSVPVRAASGEIESALLVVRNITERKRVEQKLDDHVRQSEAIASLGQIALGEHDLERLLERVTATVAETLAVDQCAVSQIDPIGDTITLIASFGFSPQINCRWSMSLVGTETVAGAAIAARGPIVVEDLRKDTRFETSKVLRDEGAVSGACVVIEVCAKPFGVLGAFSAEPRRFGPEEVSFLVSVSNLLSAAIDRQHQETAYAAAYRLVENSTDVLARHSPDSAFVYVSPQCLELWGYTPDELIGRSPFELWHREDVARAREALAGPDVQTITGRMRRKDGTDVWVETTIHQLRDADGTIRDVVSCARNIANRKQSEQQLAELAGRREAVVRQQAAVARLGQDALRAQDVETLLDHAVSTVKTTLEADLCVVLELRSDGTTFDFVASTGFREGVLKGDTVPNTPDTQAGYVLATGGPVLVANLNTEARFERAGRLLSHGVVSCISVVVEGRERPFGILSAHTDRQRTFNDDDVNFLVAVANLLSAAIQRHREEAANRHAALHDPLTGLPNRTLVLDRLELALGRRRREGVDVAVLMLDLDRFKVINDSLGHGTGDQILMLLAPRLREALGPSDTIARLGGDEFAIVCEGVNGPRGAVQAAEQLAAAIGRPLALDGGEHFLTASIGIAIASGSDDTSESLFRDADAAMYRAKGRGRGGYEVFDDEMRTQVLARLRTESELRHAIDRDELCVHYQPILDVETGLVASCEALVRWEHPTRGLVPPLDFIPIAEETGLIIEIGNWVLDQACTQAAAWRTRFGQPMQVCVNVSGHQLANPMFATEVANITRRHGTLPGDLALEITESILIGEAESPLTVLSDLHAQGIRLVLDDFGTGFSSLSYLKRFPLHTLKVDRTFVAGINTNDDDRAIVKATVEMAHAVGMNVVAEGVETADQLALVRELGCEYAQGYLFSRPLEAGAAGRFLAESLAPIADQAAA